LALSRARTPFSHADWPFEIKWDGFRALKAESVQLSTHTQLHQLQFLIARAIGVVRFGV